MLLAMISCSLNAPYVCIYVLKYLIVQADKRQIVRLYWLIDCIDNRRRLSQLHWTKIESCAIIIVRYYIVVNTAAAGVFNSGSCSLLLINHVDKMDKDVRLM